MFKYLAGCGKRPVPGNPKKFRQTIAGHGDIDMDCAAGTVFSQYTCDCQTDVRANRISHGKFQLDNIMQVFLYCRIKDHYQNI